MKPHLIRNMTREEMDPVAAVEGFSIAYKTVAAIAIVAMIVSSIRMKFRSAR